MSAWWQPLDSINSIGQKKIRQTGFVAKLVGKFDQIGQVDLA